MRLSRIFICVIIFLLSCTEGKKHRKKIGFSQNTTKDSWRKSQSEAMQRELMFHPELDFELRDADGSIEKQNRDIQQFLDQKVDLLIVSPMVFEANTAIISKVYDADIPVVILDRKTSSDKYTAFVGAENYLVGQNAGEYTNLILKNGGKVTDLIAGPESSPSIGRHKGFIESCQKYANLDILAPIISGDYDSLYLKSEIQKIPQIDLIFAHNDRLAYTAYKVCKSLKRSTKIIGVDGLFGPNEGIEMVEKGILAATILYPTGGEEAIRIAANILNGRPYNKENQLFTTVINPENVRIMKQQSHKIEEQQRNIVRQSDKLNSLNKTYSSQKNTLYTTVFLLTLVISFGSVLLFLFREKQRSNKVLADQNIAIKDQKIEIEKVSTQALQATEEKLRFYSYISHEFKTPLSLILTPTEDLIHRNVFDKTEVKNTLNLIQKNTYRLLRLVDQLLDLRKLDAGKMTLRTESCDLVLFLKDIIQDFSPTAHKRNIDLQFICPFAEIIMVFDPEKLDKVFFNLISNAFKYTPDDGRIHISLLKNMDFVEIVFSDNGFGMNQQDRDHAFDLFYRGKQNISLGTGLGLALSHEFVTLHEGEIGVESTENKGTTFRVKLPLKVDLTSEIKENQIHTPHFVEEDIVVKKEEKNATLEFENSIVIIEDNVELLTFLKNRLSTKYQVFGEESAEKGWETILKNIPDIVVSDVMLPGNDGFWLTNRLKSDFRTSHIPIILLTAKGQIESQIEGAKAGADAYIAKPFNQQLLEEKINGMIENNRRMRLRFSNEITDPHDVEKVERKFLLDFELLIEKGLKNSTLSVENLSQEMGMSRVQLYRKITALTDKNVNDYISEYKIKKSKQLLQDPTKNISEIAYELGFNNPGYFTTFFKQRTKQTPSEWRNS
jgi:signal transduction histidine kinase/DNA-binding response OmpR family regulator